MKRAQKGDIIMEELEKIMWEKDLLGMNNPQQLLTKMLYQIGLNFALRAGQDHINLRVGPQSQIKERLTHTDNHYLIVFEFTVQQVENY